MKSLKKVLFISFALMFVLAACGGSNSSKKETINILSLKPEIDEAFQAYVTEYSKANDVEVKVTTCGGDKCDYAAKLDSMVSAGNTPDIFVLEGRGGFENYKDVLADLSDEPWVSDTNYAFTDGGKTYGYPIAVEGFGLTYNKDILDAAGIDPATLTSYEAYQTAFATLEAKKSELGITAAVSIAVGPGMHWVSGNHQFNSYLAGGLESGDPKYLDELTAGKVDTAQLDDYANWTELLYKNADQTLLTQSGDVYAANVKLFTDGKTAFLHQGNWVDGDIVTAGLENVGIAPTGMGESNPTPFLSAPSFFFVSKDGNVDLAKQFLNDLHDTKEGQNFLFVDAKGISPFMSISIEPTTPLALDLYNWAQKGATAGWNQNDMPGGFGMDTLGPIHESYARGDIDKEEFIRQITAAIEAL